MVAHIYNIDTIMTDYAKLKITAEQIEKQRMHRRGQSVK